MINNEELWLTNENQLPSALMNSNGNDQDLSFILILVHIFILIEYYLL